MSFSGCFKSSRNGSPTGMIEKREMKCATLGEETSERITDLVGDLLGPGKQVFSVVVFSRGRTKVCYQQSDRYLRQEESKLPARIVTPSPPPGDESESVEEFDGALAELRQATTLLKAPKVKVEADASVVDRPLIPVPIVPSAVPVTKEEGVNQPEEEGKMSSAMTASPDAPKGRLVVQSPPEGRLVVQSPPEGKLVVQSPPECENIPDEIVRGEESADDRIFSTLGLHDQDLRGVDRRKLLVDIRAGKSPIRIADYTETAKYANRNRLPGMEPMRAQARSCARDGHPYLASAGEGERRVFTEGQRKRTVSYRSHEFMDGSVSGCFRKCNFGEHSLIDRGKGAMTSAVGEGRSMVWPMSEEAGTATWLDKVPGGPPLRFDPLPGGTGQRRCTKEEKRAVVDYALEVRKTKFAGECAKEIGIGAATLSDWIRAECQTYQAFSCLDLDSRALRTIDYRALLVDLRGGKMPICISDYIGAGKCPKRNTYECALKRFCPDTTEPSESSSEEPVSYPGEGPLPIYGGRMW